MTKWRIADPYKTTDYCIKCGESPDSATHWLGKDGHVYSPPWSKEDEMISSWESHYIQVEIDNLWKNLEQAAFCQAAMSYGYSQGFEHGVTAREFCEPVSGDQTYFPLDLRYWKGKWRNETQDYQAFLESNVSGSGG